LIKIIILEENFKWHLEAFASELFKYVLFHDKSYFCKQTFPLKLPNMVSDSC